MAGSTQLRMMIRVWSKGDQLRINAVVACLIEGRSEAEVGRSLVTHEKSIKRWLIEFRENVKAAAEAEGLTADEISELCGVQPLECAA